MGWYESATGAINVLGGIAEPFYKIFQQNKTWQREDTAVQRRVADLKAAGLSPTLAAGSAATTSSPISVNSPELDTMLVTNLNRAKADISRTDAETAAIVAKSLPDKIAADLITGRKSLITSEWNGQEMPFKDAFTYMIAKSLVDQQKAIQAGSRAAQENANLAATQAASASRSLQFDVEHNLYTTGGRSATELANILQNGKSSGQKLGIILQLLSQAFGNTFQKIPVK